MSVAAVAVITATAAVKSDDRNEISQVTDQPLAPGITVSLIPEAEMRSVVGDDHMVTKQSYGRMLRTPPRIDPALREGVAAMHRITVKLERRETD